VGLARDGAAVVINCPGNVAQASKVVAEIEKAGGRAIAMPADLSDAAEVDRLFAATINQFGRLDIVFNSNGLPQQLSR
jgi:NAD(P)-dependent dehydrogenase (short-subunit alcohol dehydrogenase family)